MAITATTGSAANSASAASLALPSFNLTAGQDVVVGVVLGSTSSSVTSITDTKGNTYTSKATLNGTGIRSELWESHSVGVQTNNIITVNVSPSTAIAAAAEEYAGVSSVGNTGTNQGTDLNPYQLVTTQDINNFTAVVIGFAAQSGDTLTAQLGTSRQSSIPAATRPGAALYDDTSLENCQIPVFTKISTARNWVTAGLELRSGGAAQTATDYPNTTAAALQAARDVRYLNVLDSLSQQLPVSGQLFPPSFPPSSNSYS